MNASEMARRRWENVSPEERSRLTRSAALARWANAGKGEFKRARSRAATAREVRIRQLAARLLGVDFSSLTGVKVEVIRSSEFRNRKRQEQIDYWRKLRKKLHKSHLCCSGTDKTVNRDTSNVFPDVCQTWRWRQELKIPV